MKKDEMKQEETILKITKLTANNKYSSKYKTIVCPILTSFKLSDHDYETILEHTLNDLELYSTAQQSINKIIKELSSKLKTNPDNDFSIYLDLETKLQNKSQSQSLVHLFFFNILVSKEEEDLLHTFNNDTQVSKSFEFGKFLDKFRSHGADCLETLRFNLEHSFNLKSIKIENSKMKCSNKTNCNILNDRLNEAFIEGLLLPMYKFDKYKTDKTHLEMDKSHKNDKNLEDEDKEKTTILSNRKTYFKLNEVIVVYPPTTTILELSKFQKSLDEFMIRIKSIYFARDLINEPANKKSVKLFIEIIKNFIQLHKLPVKMRVIDTQELKKMGMNLLVSVGNASDEANNSQLLILEYNTKTSSKKKSGKKTIKSGIKKLSNSETIVLIGKGVMFDTGGLDLKIMDENLYQEKTDMAGVAVMSSFILGYAALGGKQKIIGLMPLTRNDIGATGTHSGDIVKSYSGQTVEIINTDAEGRLLLADCLSYADKHYPGALIIDMATLTGDQAAMSCKVFSSAISRQPELIEGIVNAGNIIQERILQSPYVEEFEEYLESNVADMKNISDSACNSDLLIAGAFLGKFVSDKTRWIHLDIAGTAMNMNERKNYMPAEGSAVGVRLLFEYIKV
jgi:leucyl aminopeptidase